ncbi:unnamed protein product [Gordionus sp. m RMFG-2023]
MDLDMRLIDDMNTKQNIFWLGMTKKHLGKLEPGQHSLLPLTVYATHPGFKSISGIRLLDTFLNRTYEYDNIGQLATSHVKHKYDYSLSIWDINKLHNSNSTSNTKDPNKCPSIPIFNACLGETVSSLQWIPNANNSLMIGLNYKNLKVIDTRISKPKSSSSSSNTSASTKAVFNIQFDPFNPHQFSSVFENKLYLWDTRRLETQISSYTINNIRPIHKISWSPNRQNLIAILLDESRVVYFLDINTTPDAANFEIYEKTCSNNDGIIASFSWYNMDPSSSPNPTQTLLTLSDQHDDQNDKLFCNITFHEKLAMDYSINYEMVVGSMGSSLYNFTGLSIDDNFYRDICINEDFCQKVIRDSKLFPLYNTRELSESNIAHLKIFDFPEGVDKITSINDIANHMNNENQNNADNYGDANDSESEGNNIKEFTTFSELKRYDDPLRNRALTLCDWQFWMRDKTFYSYLENLINQDSNENLVDLCRAILLYVLRGNVESTIALLTKKFIEIGNYLTSPMLIGILSGFNRSNTSPLWVNNVNSTLKTLEKMIDISDISSDINNKTIPDVEITSDKIGLSYLSLSLKFLLLQTGIADESKLDVDHRSIEYLDLDCFPYIKFEDRIAIAFIYFSHKKLSLYMAKLTDIIILEGEIKGILLLGLGTSEEEDCEDMYHKNKNWLKLLQNFVNRTNDITIPIALIMHSKVADLVRSQTFLNWVNSYRAYLDRGQLWEKRAEFDIYFYKMCENFIYPPDFQIFVNCNFCGRSLSTSFSPEEHISQIDLQNDSENRANSPSDSFNRTNLFSRPIPAVSTYSVMPNPNQIPNLRKKTNNCPHCNKPLPRCSICLANLDYGTLNPNSAPITNINFRTQTNIDDDDSRIPTRIRGQDATFDTNAGENIIDPAKSHKMNALKEWFCWCQSCHHGGHSSHMLEWFSYNEECPITGCRCLCFAER